MIYRFIDDKGTFVVEKPLNFGLYFPLTNQNGSFLSSISPNLAGDIKRDNDHFLTPPASIEDIKNNPLCRRDFFIKTGKTTIRLAYTDKDSLEAGFLYHKVIKKTRALAIEVINFIPYNRDVEVMWVKIRNEGNSSLKFTPTSFIPLFGRAEKNLRDHRHVSALLNRLDLQPYGIHLQPTMIFDEKGHSVNESIYFVLGYEDASKPPAGQFPTLDYFCGDGDIFSPDAIEKSVPAVTKKLAEFDGKEACAAFRFKDKTLRKGEEVNYFLLMGITEDTRKISALFQKLNTPQKVRQSLSDTKEYWGDYLSRLDFDFGNKEFNNWLLWVKLQPTLRKLFGCSFLPHFDYGKGGRGWRDLWQDALALLLTEPQKVGEIIFKNFQGVRVDGSNATIITKDGGFISDRNRISRVWMDHGVWPYLTLRLYLNKTADIGFLLKEAAYFRDKQLKRAKEIDAGFSGKDYLLRTKDNAVYQGSILEHLLVQNLVPFFNVGEHNVIRLENADWNDGLDMAADRGESAAFSFMYAYNLSDMCGFLEALKQKTTEVAVFKELKILLDTLGRPVNYKSYKAKQSRLEAYFEKTKILNGRKVVIKIDDLISDLKQKAAHVFSWLKEKEWLSEGFFNGYYDNQGRAVEGSRGSGLRMMLTSQVFAIMSGGAGEQQVDEIWHSIKSHLFDRRLGGFRLNTDFNSCMLDLGRAFGFAYGEKENGAFFNHMVVMLANALYKRGFVKEGFEVISSIYAMATDAKARIYPLIPEYFNNEGRGLYLYLTGSASWYIYTLMEEVLGIKFVLGDIWLDPKLLDGAFFSRQIGVRFIAHGKMVHVVFLRESPRRGTYAIQKVLLEKTEIHPTQGKFIITKENLRKKENTLFVHLA
ncbi:MAG: cellobiose phosphorylase [Candidatus Omnitrophota bacterium]|jgi:cellobiose phosphorylase